MKDKYIYVLVLFTMSVSLLCGYFMHSNMNKNVIPTELQINNSLEKGKFIGRNAFLIYLSESDLLKNDTLNIRIDRLLQIEDSLQRVEVLK